MADALAALQRRRQKSPGVCGTVEMNSCCLNTFLLLCVAGQELNSSHLFTVPYHLYLPGRKQSYKTAVAFRKERQKIPPPPQLSLRLPK